MKHPSLERSAWMLGAAAALAAMLGWLLQPAVFPFSWLAALTFWIGWPVGCLALLLIHTLTGGRWGVAIRPQLLAGIVTLLLLVPAAIPLLFTLSHLYPWLQPEISQHLANRFYLNGPFAAARGTVYLLVWFGLGILVLLFDRRGRIPAPLAAIGLILLGLTFSFAAMDATMTLDPHFFSSDYGMMTTAEAGLFALAVCILGAALDGRRLPEDLDDLGRLLQGLLVLWAYLVFVQMLIVWQSDLPHESPWYIDRASHGWSIVAAILTVTRFVLPFFALLWPKLRRTRAGIAGVAGLLVLMEVPQAWWLVLPARHRGVSWIDIAAVIAIAGLSTGLALRAPRLTAPKAWLRHG
jgi:hypothetical protein